MLWMCPILMTSYFYSLKKFCRTILPILPILNLAGNSSCFAFAFFKCWEKYFHVNSNFQCVQKERKQILIKWVPILYESLTLVYILDIESSKKSLASGMKTKILKKASEAVTVIVIENVLTGQKSWQWFYEN